MTRFKKGIACLRVLVELCFTLICACIDGFTCIADILVVVYVHLPCGSVFWSSHLLSSSLPALLVIMVSIYQHHHQHHRRHPCERRQALLSLLSSGCGGPVSSACTARPWLDHQDKDLKRKAWGRRSAQVTKLGRCASAWP